MTDSAHTKARILDVDTQKHSESSQGVIPVVAGFQGEDKTEILLRLEEAVQTQPLLPLLQR